MDKLKGLFGLLKAFWGSSQAAKGIVIAVAAVTVGGTTAIVVPRAMSNNDIEIVSSETNVEEISIEDMTGVEEEVSDTEIDTDIVSAETEKNDDTNQIEEQDDDNLFSKKKLNDKAAFEETTEEMTIEKAEKKQGSILNNGNSQNIGSIENNGSSNDTGSIGNNGSSSDTGSVENNGNSNDTGSTGNNGSSSDTGNAGNSGSSTDNENSGNDENSSDSEGSDDEGDSSIPDLEEDVEYNLVWEDNFDGTELNRDDWNVELHAPGWVNAELQEYVDSTENIYIEDGKLVLRPVETVNADGSKSYTSGRVNTQNKHNFTYGKFEVRAKVPEGKGYLPAFWLMAADENVYGQWPRCGEIDIMEVLGDAVDTLHGTIHYGHNSTTGHSQSQGTYRLSSGSFADDFHTFSCEWEPGKITWYVDGVKYYEENDWYTAMSDGTGVLTYPAPFDQPFYIILNLAVGGSWVGYPDYTTDFENQTYEIDYVKVWQKDSYDENVKRPEAEEVVIRDPDANGNYLLNGDFEEVEDLVEAENWQFKTASNGAGKASIAASTAGVTAIAGNSAIIETTNDGDVDYSIQLLQNAVPLMAGGTYELSFDAYATEARSMKVNSKAPDNGWYAYLDKSVDLTTTKQTYTYEFEMIHSDDVNCTVEFNMGNFDSTATIVIDNVSLKLKEMHDDIRDSIINPDKSVRADGNYIYNGEFQEGDKYLGYWTVSSGADISVTSLEDGRRLKVVVPSIGSATLSQERVPVVGGANYALSMETEVPTTGSIGVAFDGASYTVPAGTNGSWSQSFTTSSGDAQRDITITFNGAGTYYLDNVRIDEDALIKNGSFNAGFSGFEPYVYASDFATYNVDSMSNDNAAAFDISKTGDQAWYIQLKQNGVILEKNQWYKLSLGAKSTVDRKLMFAIQRDGSKHNDDWTPYSGEKKVDLTSSWQTFDLEFQMTEDTDLESVLSISMGAVDGIVVNGSHSVYIDNITLEKIDEPEMGEVVVGENMLLNPEFANDGEHWNKSITSPAAGTMTMGDGSIIYALTNVGTEDWHAQLIQMGLQLEQSQIYRVSFKARSTEARTIKANVMSASYSWYGGSDVVLEKDTVKDVSFDVVMSTTDTNGGLYVSLGKIAGEDTPASTITLSDFSVVKVGGGLEEETPDVEKLAPGTELIVNGDFAKGSEGWSETITSPAEAATSYADGKAVYTIKNVGTENTLQLMQKELTLENGVTYNVKFTLKSSVNRPVKWAVMDEGTWVWHGGNVVDLMAGEEKTVEATVTAKNDSEVAMLQFSMSPAGDMPLDSLAEHTIEFDNISVIKVSDGTETQEVLDMNLEGPAEAEAEETTEVSTEETIETTEEESVEEIVESTDASTETAGVESSEASTETIEAESIETAEETTTESTEATEETTIKSTEATEETKAESTETTEETTTETTEATEETKAESTEITVESTTESTEATALSTTDESAIDEETEDVPEPSTVDIIAEAKSTEEEEVVDVDSNVE